jgi:hypothetical protein
MDNTKAFIRSQDGTLEIVVNFGLLSGREATVAEVDRLGRRICNVAGDVRVEAVRIHEMGHDSEAIVSQVVVHAVAAPDAETIRAICEDWAVDCANERSIEPLEI